MDEYMLRVEIGPDSAKVQSRRETYFRDNYSFHLIVVEVME